jgi:UDP-glucose 4-epimerase
VGSVCNVLLDACERSVTHPEPVNLAFGTNTSILELVRTLEDVSGLSADVRHRGPRPGDVPHSQANSELLMSLFPSVEQVALNEGLGETIAWFRSNQ